MAFESSISIRYILADQPESRLLAYFQHYKKEEQGRLEKWREATQKLSEPAKREQAEAIALRTRGVEALSHIIDRLENEFRRAGIALVSESWPNLFERFKKLEAAITHRTVYARMSGQVHSDAEETIRYIIGIVSNDADFMERMAAETVWFSRLMLYLAVSGFVHASLAYCHIYRMGEELAVLKRGQLLICEELDALARNAPDNT